MKKYFYAFAITAMLGIMFTSCDKDEVMNSNSRAKGPEKPEYDEELAKKYNEDFDGVAFAVNQLLLKNADFRMIVKEQVGKRFDGDFNVLISQLVVNHKQVVDWFKEFDVDICGMVEKYPLIQIAIPIEYEKWEGDEGLPIVYLPAYYQENETPFLYGYDREGKLWEVKESWEPDFPVAVISENERTLLLAKAPENPEELTPSAPRELVATTTAIGIKLTWLKPTSGTITGYDIYRKGAFDANYSRIYSIYNEDNLHYEDIYIQPQLNYSYYITAFYEEEDGHQFYIVRGNPFVLGHIHRAPGQKHSSPPSNYVTANAPAQLPTPTEVKLTHGGAKQFLLEWSGQSALTQFYEIWRMKIGETDFSLQGTTSANNNYFIQNGLSAGIKHIYKVRAMSLNGHYTDWSPGIASFASERNDGAPLKLLKCKFKDKAALRKVESAWKGNPEMWLTIARGFANSESERFCTMRFESNKPEDIYNSWYTPSNNVIRPQYHVAEFGTILTFQWVEEDANWGSTKITIDVNYESKLDPNNTIKTGTKLELTINDYDDPFGQKFFYWWDAKNTQYANSDDSFYWYVD